MLTVLKVSSLACYMYFTDQNIMQRGNSRELNFKGPQMQKWNIPTDRAQRENEKNWVICLIILFSLWVMVVEMLKMANFLGRFVDDVFSILKRTHLENFFYRINNLDQNIKLAMEIALLKRNNGKVCVLVYWKPTPIDQLHLHYITSKQMARKVLFPPCLIETTPLSSIKMT